VRPSWVATRPRNRQLTTARERPARAALGTHAGIGIGVVQCGQQRNEIAAILPAFDGQCALPRRGKALLGRHEAGNAPLEPQPLQTGGGQHQRVVLATIQFCEPRIEIAAHRQHLDMRMTFTQLRLAAQARTADAGAVRENIDA
jgi:hypothetical protein